VLAEAFGRTLALDVVSRRVQPQFANSAMDGHALRAADAARAMARLTVVGESAAGRPFSERVGPGEAARIFTGAPLPEGADAVVTQEVVRREGATVILAAPVAPGAHVRAPGGDFNDGELVLRAGRRMTARDLALAAAANHPTLAVRRRPRVAILASGDELVAPGAALGPAQIVAPQHFRRRRYRHRQRRQNLATARATTWRRRAASIAEATSAISVLWSKLRQRRGI
jgi:molybdopterin molybdotransferase